MSKSRSQRSRSWRREALHRCTRAVPVGDRRTTWTTTVGQGVLGTCFSRPDRSPGCSEGRLVQSMQLLGIERKGQWYPCEGHKQSNPARSDSMSVPARLGRKLAVYDAFETNRLVSRSRTRTTADPTANSTVRRSWHTGACKSAS